MDCEIELFRQGALWNWRCRLHGPGTLGYPREALARLAADEHVRDHADPLIGPLLTVISTLELNASFAEGDEAPRTHLLMAAGFKQLVSEIKARRTTS